VAIEERGLLVLEVERWIEEYRCSSMRDDEDVAVDWEEAS
jgi:hypothetical protein